MLYEVITIGPLHVTVNAFLLETLLELGVFLQPVRVAAVAVNHTPVMTVPTGIVGREVRRRIAR